MLVNMTILHSFQLRGQFEIGNSGYISTFVLKNFFVIDTIVKLFGNVTRQREELFIDMQNTV